jgi:hypothetical protein
MATVLFDKNGEQLKVQFKVVLGVLRGAYTIELISSDGINTIDSLKGDNLCSEDDWFILPQPLIDNDGRLVQLTVDFIGDLSAGNKYKLGFEIYQGNDLVGPVFVDGNLSSGEQSKTVYVQIKAR